MSRLGLGQLSQGSWGSLSTLLGMWRKHAGARPLELPTWRQLQALLPSTAGAPKLLSKVIDLHPTNTTHRNTNKDAHPTFQLGPSNVPASEHCTNIVEWSAGRPSMFSKVSPSRPAAHLKLVQLLFQSHPCILPAFAPRSGCLSGGPYHRVL